MANIGACGINCEYCLRFQASQPGNIEELEKLKTSWVKIGLLEKSYPARELACCGCNPKHKCGFPEVLNCVTTREIKNCGYCNSYPCEKINAVFEKKDSWLDDIKNKCTQEEYAKLIRAFCKKKMNLDKIYQQNQKGF